MKIYLAGAAALLLGTTALAQTWDEKSVDPAAGAWDLQPAGVVMQKASGELNDMYAIGAKGEIAPVGLGSGEKMAGDELAYAEPGAGYAEPTELAYADPADVYADPADQPVSTLDPVDPMVTDDPAGTGAPVDTIDSTTALGETSVPVQTAALDLSPRPASQNYPACEPGPGDDSCIQLYEPGVEVALANWSGTTGGFAGDAGTATAMGGPEPDLDAHASDLAAVDDESLVAAEAPIETAMVEPDPAIPLAEGDPAYAGVGGPIVEGGYPPCSGAASDDRCIQLYEPGMTGEDN